MGYVRFLAALSILFCSNAFGQGQTLSISNYRFVSQQILTPTYSRMTYRADLVNTGPDLVQVTATVASLDPFSARVIPGQGTLNFMAVPAKGQVASSDTFTLLVDTAVPFSFANLQWTFQTTFGPVADAGPNTTAAVGDLVRLNGSGSTNPSGVGTLTYSWVFTSLPPGSMAFLGHSGSVVATFVVDVPGTYVVALTVSNGVSSSASSVTVSTTGTPPVANAGPNQTLPLHATAVLNGSGSTSVDGRPLTYSWSLIARPAGSTAQLTGAATLSPTFVLDVAGTYVAQLVVNDGLASSPATVTVTTQAAPPTASAGPSQMVGIGALVQLNGAGSTDPNGLPLTYQWSILSLPAGSVATLNGATKVNPSFTADRGGTYVVQLIVNNGVLGSAPATVTITTQAQLPPTANAGANQTASVGNTVTLSGSGTDPQNLPLTFHWSLITKPALSAANLSNTAIPNPTFVADVAGTYVAQLIVNNGVQNSAPSTVTITAGTRCSQPTANPGPNQNVSAGASVTLDGSGSGGSCGAPLTYSWSLTTRPGGSAAALSRSNTVSPSFVADVAGTYVVQLIVNNGSAASNPATATVTASGLAGIILPGNVTLSPSQSVPFLVTLASPAPVGSVFVTLTSSDPSIATVFPTGLIIVEGAQAPSRTPVVTGISAGSATITASVYGMASASRLVQVTSGSSGATMSFSPASLTFNGIATQYLVLSLSAFAPSGGLTVNVSSSNAGVATVPAIVSFGPNASSVSLPVTAVGPGLATITASATGIPNTTAGVTVTLRPSVNLPASATVATGQSVAYAVSLSAPPPAGGVSVTLTSSDTSKVTVTPSVFIAGGSTSPVSQAQAQGIRLGSATITASAPGYTTTSGQLQVIAGGGSIYFLPGNVAVSAGTTQYITLVLSAPAPGDLAAILSSNNVGVFTVPSTVTIPAGATIASVPLTGVAPGSATLAASARDFGSASVPVTVASAQSVSVTWYGACWQTATIYGVTGNFQAIDFAITTPAPVTMQGSLFFAPNCDASQGVDNMNDFGTLTGSGHMVRGFTHFPDLIPSSAMYWVGPLTVNQKCSPGSPCSGCVNYTPVTPNCSILP